MNPVPPLMSELAECYPDVTNLVTEDDTPLDNMFSGAQQRLLVNALRDSWTPPNKESEFVAAANVGLFFSLKKPPLVPDFLLSLEVEIPEDLWIKEHRSYFVWLYEKPPDVVVEVVSNKEGGEDSDKIKTYARIQVPYYVIFDPQCLLSEEVLRVYRLIDKHYERIAPEWLPGIGLGLKIWRGTFEGSEAEWLRWTDQNGAVIPTGAERAAVVDQRFQEERLRAEQEKQRAEQEKQRAEQEKQRAERLAAQLRALGMEPEA